MSSMISDTIREKHKVMAYSARKITTHGRTRFQERVGYLRPEVSSWTDERILAFCLRKNVDFRFVWRQDTHDVTKMSLTTVLFNCQKIRDRYEKEIAEKEVNDV